MLSEILRTLYSHNGDVYQILNASRHITEIKKNTEVVLLFNTGFRFHTHKGTPIDLYFDLMKPEIIRVPISPLPIKPPQLIGAIGEISESKYLEKLRNDFCIWINSAETILRDPEVASDDPKVIFGGLGLVDYQNIDEVLKNGSSLSTIDILDSNGESFIHSSFQIISGEELIELPLRRTFGQLVFFDGRRFSEFIPSSRDNLKSREEWLEEEFGTDAGTAYWNID